MVLQEKNYIWVVFIAAIVASFVYGYLAFTTAPQSGSRILNSPDEAANYYFATQLSEKNKFVGYEPINQFAENIIHPRAITAYEGKLVPVSFMGMSFIYGNIAKIFGSGIIIYLTLIISVIGAIYFYLFIKEIFDSHIALISTFLLLLFPGWVYYNSRSMFHNVLFVNLLIIAIYYLHRHFKNAETWPMALSALFFGLALITRTSEIVWVDQYFDIVASQLLFENSLVI